MSNTGDQKCIDFINGDNTFEVTARGIVPKNFENITAIREEDGGIFLKFKWTKTIPKDENISKPGYITKIKNETVLGFRNGAICKLVNLSEGGGHSYSSNEGYEIYKEYRVQEIEITYPTSKECKWEMLHIGNANDLRYTFDKSSEGYDRNLSIINFDGLRIIDEKSYFREHGGYSLIKVAGKEYYLFIREHSAFILSELDNNRELSDWQKILNCLSFALGRYLILTGKSCFNEDWESTQLTEISAYTEKGALQHDLSQQPCPLGKINDNGTISLNFIDSDRLSKFVSNMLDVYDEHNFGYMIFVYFYGYHLPAHISPVYYAAAIEALMGSIGEKISSNIIATKPQSRLIRRALKKSIEDCSLSDEQKDNLKGNIDRINFLPIKEQIAIFCKRENLNFGDIEKNAWGRRNSIAHGRFEDQKDMVSTIKDLRVIRILMVRIILSLLDDEWCYFDYTSVNFPIRFLKDGPSQEGV